MVSTCLQHYLEWKCLAIPDPRSQIPATCNAQCYCNDARFMMYVLCIFILVAAVVRLVGWLCVVCVVWWMVRYDVQEVVTSVVHSKYCSTVGSMR